MDEPWRLPAEVMCRVQREKTWYSGQRGCILSPCQGQNGNPGELLNVEVFDTLWEAKVLAERWRREYNQRRPHSALAYRPPAPEARLPRSQDQSSIPWSGLQMVPGLT